MKQMEKWNNCQKIFGHGKVHPELSTGQAQSCQQYINSLLGTSPTTVWYDYDDKVCFGPDKTFGLSPGEFSFFSSKENFIDDKQWGDAHLQQKLGAPLGKERIITSEYIFQHRDDWGKYKGKNILIVGAGPSTKEVDWQDLNIEYDYIWSCNKFYKNQKLQTERVDLSLVGPEVDLFNKDFLEKIKADKTLCVFEGGVSPFRGHYEIRKFRDEHLGLVSYSHLRYFSKLGAGVRLLPLAAFLKPKNIYFVGVDGYPVNFDHAFEGSSKKHQGAPLTTNAYNIYRRQFVLLWDYLLNTLKSKVKFHNLGEGHPANQSSDISKKHFH